MGLALAGLVLVVAPWRLHGLLSSFLALAGGFAWAASALVVKLMQRRRHVDVLSLTTWQMVFGSVPLVAHRRCSPTAPLRSGPLPFAAALAYTLLLANILAWALWTVRACAPCRPARPAWARWRVPALGVLAAWLQLGERPDAVEAAGMVLIVGALAVLAGRGIVASRREPAAADETPAVPPMID